MSIEKNVNEGILNKDINSKRLIDYIVSNDATLNLEEAILHYKFPLYLDDNSLAVTADLLLISKHHGVFVIKCDGSTARMIDGNQQTVKIIEDLEQVYTQIYSKLIKSKVLREKPTELKFQVVPILFLPNYEGDVSKLTKYWDGLKVVLNFPDLKNILDCNKVDSPIEARCINETVAILEGSKGIIKVVERDINETNRETKGGVLGHIETDIANFDIEQKRAALYVLDGPQRIRGLAGSGKTIVLTMKAAQIHLQDPNAEILYTYYTKSLYSFIKRLITRFFRQFADKDPNWEKIHIMHAWGGTNLEGVYYNSCTNNGIVPRSFSDVKSFKSEAFNEVCKLLLSENAEKIKSIYDYAILDEAQDFPKYFYRLCLKLTQNKRLIWGYDECQNILDIDIQDTKETFGNDKEGRSYIDFSSDNTDKLQDLVLHRCYRNPREILICAFALGLGIYSNRILQMPENNDHWKDLGFEVIKGESQEGDQMVITRPEKNSPLKKNVLFESEDLVIQVLGNIIEECQYVADHIEQDIKSNLLPNDILVVSVDDMNARRYFDVLVEKLNEKGIKSFNLLTAPANTRSFVVSDHITLSTVYRAKGNEAGSVYVVGVDAVFMNKDLIKERNKLFTAITRAKGWVTLTGVGEFAKLCALEVANVKAHYPNFVFTMPNRKSMKIFQRDLSNAQNELNKVSKVLDQLVSSTGLSKEELLRILQKGQGNK